MKFHVLYFALLIVCIHCTESVKQPIPISDNRKLAGLHCSGTEPFWSLVFNEHDVVFSNMAVELQETLKYGESINATGRPEDFIQVVSLYDNESIFGQVVIQKSPQCLCSDGMSDILYPYSILLLLQNDTVLEGCARFRKQENNEENKNNG